MRLTFGGNLGIRTTEPNSTLDVSGSVNISGSGTTIPFQITSGSTSLMYVSSSGQMGIGTSAPAFRVQVSMPVSTDNFAITSGGNTLRFSGNIGSGNPGIASSGVIHFQSPINGTGGTEILQVRKAGGANFIQYWSSNTGTTLSAIDGTGRLGIGTGTTLLSASLHISGASSATLLEIDSPTVNNILFVSGSGNVGIGTGTPNARLDVSGTVKISDGGRLLMNQFLPLGIVFRNEESNDVGGNAQVSDIAATNGNAKVRTSGESSGTFFFGPYTTIPAGTYIAHFRLKVTNNSSSSTILLLDVTNVISGGGVNISPSNFTASNRYQYFKIPFTVKSPLFVKPFVVNEPDVLISPSALSTSNNPPPTCKTEPSYVKPL
jgi:hypothetical protein